MLTFTIEGTPAPQGSKRHVGGGRMIESSKKLKPWRDKLIRELRAQHTGKPLDEPIEVTAVFFVPKPARPKFPVPATPADLDKYQRSLGDALEQAGVITNDSRIVTWIASKQYDPDGFTGVFITIKEAQ